MMKIVLVVLTVAVVSQAQVTAPEYDQLGCPVLKEGLGCPENGRSCVAHDNQNVYKTVRARSWWHCGEIF